MKQRKISKTGLALVGAMVVCLLICLAVLLPKGGLGGSEAEDLNDADTPDLKTVMDEGTPVMIYDKRTEAQALVAAYENGTMEKIEISWEDGTDLTVDQPSEIKEIYRLFKNIVVAADAETASAGDDVDGADPEADDDDADLDDDADIDDDDTNVDGDDADVDDDGEAEIDLAFWVEDEAPCEYTLIGDSALTIGDEDYRVTGAEALVKYLNTLK